MTAVSPAPGPAPGPSAQVERIVDATLRCICRWGMAKTTLDDVAREAGCSRATVYRLFPGGKDGLMETVARTELSRFFDGIAARLEVAETLEDMLVDGMAEAGRRLLDHKPLQYLLVNEPEAVLPHLAFAEMEQVLKAASAFAAPHLSRFIAEPDEALRAAEWVARLVVSYAITPSEATHIDDEGSVRALVNKFVLPGLQHTI